MIIIQRDTFNKDNEQIVMKLFHCSFVAVQSVWLLKTKSAHDKLEISIWSDYPFKS